MPRGNCEFKGTGGQYFVTVFIHLFVLTLVTFGIYGAWAWVRVLKLKASHTLIDGKNVSFIGNGSQLFLLLVVQGLLTIITFGIYGPWAICKVVQWRTLNTLVGDRSSKFTGSGGSLFFFYLIHFLLLPLITLGLYHLLGIGLYRFYAWKEERTLYGGERASFGGRYTGFLKVTLLTWILNTITFGLATPWTLCMFFKWQIEGLAVGNGEDVEHFPPVKTNFLLVFLLIIFALVPVFFIVFMFGQIPQQFNLSQLGKGTDSTGTTVNSAGKTKIKRKVAVTKKEEVTPAKDAAEKTSVKPSREPAGKQTDETTEKALKEEPKEKQEQDTKERPKEKAKGKPINYREEFAKLNELIEKDKDKNADLYYNRAFLYASKGDSSKAIEDYEMALKIDDRYADAYYNRGILYAEMERYERALSDFNKAVEIDPKAYDALCNSGNVYFEMGKYDFAVRDYTRALEIKPDDADIYKNRGLAYKALGQTEKAKTDEAKSAELRKKQTSKPRIPAVSQKNESAAGSSNVSSGWKEDLTGVNIPEVNAQGMINGDRFDSVSASIPGNILTIRDGKDFFPDHAVKIFLFLKKGESAEGRTFNITRNAGVGSPHVHMQWKPSGKDVPETKVFTTGYAMLLEFGKADKDGMPGKIYLCMPDETKSFVAGTFVAAVK